MNQINRTNQPTLTLEESLVFLACRLNLDRQDSARMKDILKQGPDWSIVKRYAGQLGIEPLLYKHLSHVDNTRYVPGEIKQSLKGRLIIQWMANRNIYQEIKCILDTMNKSNIPIILLKGAYLANYIYGDIALRPMGDIDILVSEEDRGRVPGKLRDIEFEKSGSFYPSDFHENHLADKVDHLTPMLKPGMCPVEVHFNIFAGFPYKTADMENVWQTAETGSLNGFRVKVLSPEYQLLHLCLHLYNHVVPAAKGRIIAFYWLCDIHELIKRLKNKIDWDKFCNVTGRLKVNTQVLSILAYMRHYWNTPIPEQVLHYSDKDINVPCFATIIRDILNGSKAKRSHVHRYINKTRNLLAKDSKRCKFYFLWKEIFPMRNNLINRYNIKNSSFVYVYYIIHPCRLLARAVTSTYHNTVYLFRNRS